MSQNIVRVWKSKIIRQREDGYVCLTDMAQAAKKQLNDWTRQKGTQRYLDALSSVTGIPVTLLVQVFQGGEPSEQGTWGHPKVSLRFAQWCSEEFAVQVDFWIDELLSKGTVAIDADPRLVLLEQLTQLTHNQIEIERRQKELELQHQRMQLEQSQIKAGQIQMEETLLQHDAEIGRIFEPDGMLVTLAGCLGLHGGRATAAQLAQVGRLASKMYREKYGKAPEKIGDARYGKVAAYPQAIAEHCLKEFGYIN